jgi:hypothetical protein
LIVGITDKTVSIPLECSDDGRIKEQVRAVIVGALSKLVGEPGQGIESVPRHTPVLMLEKTNKDLTRTKTEDVLRCA